MHEKEIEKGIDIVDDRTAVIEVEDKEITEVVAETDHIEIEVKIVIVIKIVIGTGNIYVYIYYAQYNIIYMNKKKNK